MNKNLKKVIAIALAFGTISAVAPVSAGNLLTTKVYASTDENSDTTLDSLELKTSSGSTLKLYDSSSYDSKVNSDDVSEGDTYYVKTSSKTVNVDISGPSSKYVKVFKGTSNSTKGKSVSNDIDLSSGSNTITVRVYSSKPDSDVRYDDDYENQYILKVKYTGSDSSDSSSDSSSSDNADSYDNIYLDKLSIAGESISLSQSKVNYTYNVASDVDQVTIKAVPEDQDNDTVSIDGSDVDDSDNYKKTIDLNKGENKIEVEVSNSDDNTNRVYKLTITRGGTSTTNSTSDQTATTTPVATTVKLNQWVQINGGWQYNDSLGNPVKNQWFLDRNLGKWYYLGVDGFMASNTIINGYRVGADGAWIK